MNKLFQLRNKLSNRVLTNSQQKNTKGRGRDKMEKDFSFDYIPVSPSTPNSPSMPSVPTTQSGGKTVQQRGNPSGPPQFGSGGPSFSPII